MKIPIIALSVLLAALSSCKEGTDHTFDGLWAVYFMLHDEAPYNNCSVQPTVLSSGTHHISLAEGQEYWFDFRSRRYVDVIKQYSVTVQEQLGQNVKAVYMNCMRRHGITNPVPRYTMGSDYLSDSGSAGALEVYTVETSAALYPGEFAVILKSVTGNGTIGLTIPSGPL